VQGKKGKEKNKAEVVGDKWNERTKGKNQAGALI